MLIVISIYGNLSEKQGFITNQMYCNTSPVQNIVMQSVWGGSMLFLSINQYKAAHDSKTEHYYKSFIPCVVLSFSFLNSMLYSGLLTP